MSMVNNQQPDEILAVLADLENGKSLAKDSCPNCGCTHRVFETYINHRITNGVAAVGATMYSSRSEVGVMPLSKFIGSTVPYFIINKDICSRCTLEYPIKIDRRDKRIVDSKGTVQ